MRSIWKGMVSFGLVSVPVKLYGATEDHDVKAHQVHATDGGQIRLKRVCEVCDTQVEMSDIAKSYDHGDQKVVLTDDDKASITEESNRVIEVLEFVPASELDPMLFEASYYLAPEKGADKPYVLLTQALLHSERVALTQFAMRGKTRLAALRVLPKEGILVMHTLKWPDEIRHPEFPIKEVEIKRVELDLADRLIKSMANEFNPDRYRDTYQEELTSLIAAKASGATLPAAAAQAEATDDVSDLLAKLEASIAKKGKK